MKKIQRKIILMSLFSILGIAFTFGQLTCNENVVVSLTIGGDDPAAAKIFAPQLVENESGFDNLEVSRDGVTFGDFVKYYCCDIGQNVFFVRGTDAAGNIETCSGTLLVDDLLAPAAIVTGPVYLGLFGQSSVELTEDMLPLEVLDNCGSSTITLSQSVFSSVGTYNVTYTLSDESGNSAMGNIEVIVTSGEVIVCNNSVNVSLDNNGLAIITPDMVLEGAIFANGQYQLSADGGPFTDVLTLDCGEAGDDVVQIVVKELTLGIECWGTLSIEDKLSPTIDIQVPVYLSLGGATEVELTTEMLSPYVHENCSIESHNLSQSAFTSAGTYDVIYTVADTDGNSSTKILHVIITDISVPLACYNNVEVELDNQGNVTIDPSIQLAAIYLNYNFKVGVGDPVEGIIEFFDQVTLDCFHLGLNTIQVLDEISGNSCWGQIEVKDVDAPTPFAFNEVVVSMNGSNPYVLDPALVDAGSFDNCEVGSMIVSPTTFYVPGTYEVKLTIFDTSGNSDYALTTVIVEGGGAQSMECIGLSTASTEPFGPTTLWAVDFVLNDEDFDDFGMSLEPSGSYTESFDFDCSMFDLNAPIDLYIRGGVDGEYSYCSVALTLVDVTPPVAVVDQNVVLQLINGQAALLPSTIDDGSYDLCGSITMSLSQTIFTTADLGDNQVVLTVTDGSGNTNQGVTIVTVSDFENLVSVNTITGRAMKGVTINDAIETDDQGNAQVEADIFDIDYDDHYLNGVNVLDLVVVQRYILGLDNLDDVFLDAADFNNDDQVKASDLLAISETIQGITTDYQWKFTDLAVHNGTLGPKAIYSAFKKGDIDDSALLSGSDPLMKTAEFEIDDLLLNNGESYDVPIYLNEDFSLYGLEMRIGIDPELVEIDDVTSNMDFIFTEFNVNDDNELVILMFDPISQETDEIPNGAVVNVSLTAKSNGLLNEALDVEDKFSFGVDDNVELIVIGGQLNDVIGTGTNSEELSAISVFPNPTSDYLNIDKSKIAVDGEMVVEIYNLSGQKLRTTFNQSKIDVSNLNGGMYYYRIKIREFQTTDKFIVVK